MGFIERHQVICGLVGGDALLVAVVILFGVLAVAAESFLPGARWYDRCLSAWDGSHGGTNSLIKEGLADRDSFEHRETFYSPDPLEDGTHALRVRYTFKNAQGGREWADAYSFVDPATCEAVDVW